MNRHTSATCAAILLGLTLHAQAQPDTGAAVIQSIEAKYGVYADVAKQIWSFAELGYKEQKSSALLQAHLKAAGFDVKAGLAEIPTAFTASYGSGKPVIGIVGEFDALPGLSQQVSPSRMPIVDGAPGHGCGHNLLGTGSLAAAVAVKEWLASTHQTGTVLFFGTPAEEGGSGKVFMIRAELFSKVDAVIAWHPSGRNDASPKSNLATIQAKFRFHGVAAHAGSAPDKGRSALDAVEAMNHMVNLMREHVPQETRMHYIITRGGAAPNIVSDFAESYYNVRQPDMLVLDGIWDRIINAAQGAALGTGTTVNFEVIGAAYNLLPNEVLSGIMRKNLERVGGVKYTAEEQHFAEQILKTLIEPPTLRLGSQEVVQPMKAGSIAKSSTDLGDVSWNVPTVEVVSATFVPGIPMHSWQAAACAGSDIGIKGMMVAAKSMALTVVDLFTDPTQIQKARAEFDKRRGPGFVYRSRLDDRKPPLDYRN